MRKLIHWIISIFQQKKDLKLEDTCLPDLVFINLIDEPEIITPGYAYILGHENNPYQILFNCPCQCGDVIQLNLLTSSNPYWSLRKQYDNLSLYPSVWRTKGCKSHFWIRNGMIQWL